MSEVIVVPPLPPEMRRRINGEFKCGCGMWFASPELWRDHAVTTQNYYCEVKR